MSYSGTAQSPVSWLSLWQRWSAVPTYFYCIIWWLLYGLKWDVW